MERAGVWPTPLNFELWLHYLDDPDGALAQEMARLLLAGECFNERTAEFLAAEYLPNGRLTEEVRHAGAVLDRELSAVSKTMEVAKQSHAAFGHALAKAAVDLQNALEPAAVLRTVAKLTTATTEAQNQNAALGKLLQNSTSEVARLREHLEHVRRESMTDAVTNLANRKAFDEELLRACDESERKGEPMTLAMLDIDHFKTFNDTWGHQTGDQVLRYVAGVIGRVSRSPRFAARYGGEEFAIIFPDERAPEVEAALNQIREEVAARTLRRRSTNDDLGAVTFSAGLAQHREGETGSSLLDRADQALYSAKRTGRNKVTNGERLENAA